jgi:tRNA-2-methylthio-N6-dimethylallyladenosine synthase
MMDDDVPHEEKKRRLNAIDTLQESVSAEINLALQGTTQEILVEGQKRGRWFGRTRNDKLVYFDDEINRSGEMVKVRIEQAGSWSLQGALTV